MASGGAVYGVGVCFCIAAASGKPERAADFRSMCGSMLFSGGTAERRMGKNAVTFGRNILFYAVDGSVDEAAGK